MAFSLNGVMSGAPNVNLPNASDQQLSSAVGNFTQRSPVGPVSSTPLTDTIQSLPPSNFTSPISFTNQPKAGLPITDTTGNTVGGYDSSGQAFGFMNNQLNNAQNQTFDTLSNSPTPPDDRVALANGLINNAINENTDLTGQLNAATTGANDLRTQTQNYYNNMGIDDLVQQINQAQSDYYNTEAQKNLNLFNVEGQYAGGGTEGFAKAMDERQQRNIAVQSLASSIRLNALQNQLNTKMDAFKVFAGQAQNQQQATINSVSQQLGLNKQDLSQGVSILNQLRQETQFNEENGRVLLTQLISSVPGIASSLTPQEINAVQTGTIPPSVVAKIGATYKDISAGQAQQRVNVTSALDYTREINNLTTAAINSGIDTSSPQFQNLIGSMMNEMQNQGYTTPASTFGSGLSGGSLVSSNPNPNAVIATSTGATYDMTSYASGNATGGPASQAANIQATLAQLPPITDANSAQQAISSLKPNSPITGQMVMQAAQATGVDPSMIIATMQAESQLATDGSKGAQQNNPGNVGNTDSLMASGGSTGYPTMQDGVMAVAQNLAKRQVQSTGTQSGQSNQLSGMASQYQDSTNYYGDSQYITTDKLFGNEQQKRIAQQSLNAQGIATLSAKNGDILMNIDAAKQNLQDFSTMIDNANIQPKSWYGRTYGATEASLQSWLQTNGITGAYDTWYAQAVGLVSALKATGTGQGGSARLFNDIEAFLPKKTDTVATAKTKIDSLNTMLDNGAKSILGRFYKDQADTAAQSLGGYLIK